MKKLVDKAMVHFSQIPEKQWKKWTYLVTHTYEGMIRVAKPVNHP